GDPGMKLGEDRMVAPTLGNPNGVYIPNSEGKNPDSHRIGIGYMGFGSFRFGINSEKVRSGIQNNFHRLIGSPDFKLDKSFNDKPHVEFNTGGSTLLD